MYEEVGHGGAFGLPDSVVEMLSVDMEAALSAGYDILHGLIGPGVYASHGYERTHREGVENMLRLLAAYIQEPMPETGWKDSHDKET